MRADQQNAVRDRFGGLFKGAGARDWAEVDQPAGEVDLVRTGPGQGWPTFEEIMAQVPDGPAKVATRELREMVRRTPIRVCWDEGDELPLVLVCPIQWRRENLRLHKRAYRLLLSGAGGVIEAYMGRAGLLPAVEEAEGEPWGRV